MRRKKKNERRNNKKINGSQLNQDITLNDFANVAISGNKGRLRKPLSCNKVKNLNPDDSWDINDSEEFQEKKNSRRKKTNSDCEEIKWNVYPTEIWYILSRFIRPEDVGRFAGICFVCNEIVNTASFWFDLYKRYYQPIKNMPERLQPECMTRLYELKSCVVRALYYMYPPLAAKYYENINKLNLISQFSNTISLDLHFLFRRKCTSIWCESKSQVWHCNFILKREYSNTIRVMNKKCIPDLLATLNNISYNKAEGCVLLQVIFNKFIVTPSVLGLTLTSVSCDVNTVSLIFSNGITSSCNTVTVTFNSVKAVHIHNWWSPQYPHSNNFSPSVS